MSLANVRGRAALVLGDEIADVEEASSGAFGPDLATAYRRWDELVALTAGVTSGTGPLVPSDLGCRVPKPRQVFAIGLNYRSHAEESGMSVPAVPGVFTKFPASLAGPFDDIEIVGDTVDWEVELVAVIGRTADRVPESDGWAHVAGLTVGRTSPTARCSSPPARCSRSANRGGATAQWARESSPPTNCRTPTPSPSAARSTARSSTTPPPTIWSTACRG